MASNPPFVPRSLQKGRKLNPQPKLAYVPPAAGPSTLTAPASDKDEWTDDDIVLLYEMCLSDYALWSDSTMYDAMTANDGYISLRQLDAALTTVKRPEDARVAKALRARSERLEIRMLISQPDRNNWFGRGDRYETGGYEVRRKDWPLASVHALSMNDWNARSVYVENLPHDARSLVGVARLARDLLGSTSSCIQNVSFPAHFQAKPGEVSRCKGFAFVVFDSPELASRFISAWPWNRDSATDAHGEVSDPRPAQQAALTSGLRCLPHERWITLKNEYLTYQASLVEAATRSTSAAAAPSSSALPAPSTRKPAHVPLQRAEVHVEETANFPRNRLVLMRGIPLGATKTSIRVMLSQALEDGEGIDYIDFVKNVDRCHVRLSSPEHARRLVTYFDGRGDEGTRAELVQGEQEAIYWDKVPEKLRKAAMGLTSAAEPVDSKRPRKRQKQTK